MKHKLEIGVRCETCGTREGLTASHFVKKNSVHKDKYDLYDYDSPENYFTQCIKCHQAYEKLGTKKKFENQTTRQEYMRLLSYEAYAKRIEYWVNP